VSPTLLLPGDWTSPNLLVRILYTIGSDWALGSEGLVDRVTGAVATVRMGPADPELAERMAAHDDPVYPSLTDERVQAIDAHKAVVELSCADDVAAEEACRALLSCGAALVDAGAHAVWVPSGLAHGPERWQSLAAAARSADPADADGEEEAAALFRAFVRPISKGPGGWRTVGLPLLGQREVVVDDEVAEPYAYDVLEALGQRLVAGMGLHGGEVLQPGRTGPRLLVSDAADPDPAADRRVWRVRAL